VLLLRTSRRVRRPERVAGRSFTEHAQFASKATNARFHGARGVIVVNDMPSHAGETDQMDRFTHTVGPGNAGIAFVQVKWELATAWPRQP